MKRNKQPVVYHTVAGAVAWGLLTCIAGQAEQESRTVRHSLQVDRMTCEYLDEPVGIDIACPRLNWSLLSSENGARQTAYRIQVASTRAKLEAGEADLWDSEKVLSDRSVHVRYAGRTPASHDTCWWRVRAWDGAGRESPWSKTSRWTMGVLTASEWRAKWIGYTEPPARRYLLNKAAEKLSFSGCSWMWADMGKPVADLPKGSCVFRYTLDLPSDSPVKWAYLLIAADDRYWLHLNSARISISREEDFAWKQGYEVELTHDLKPGPNTFAVRVENRSEGPAGIAGKLVVELANGNVIEKPVDASWKASKTAVRDWHSQGLDHRKWASAVPMGKVGGGPWGMVPQAGHTVGWLQKAPSPLLRKTFPVAGKAVRFACIHVCGLGFHELRLNGQKVGNHQLDPPFTRYDRRSLYVTHDVTTLLRSGENAVGLMLGNGWYNMHTRATWDFDQAPWRGEPCALLHLHIAYEDGSVQTVVSDETWEAATGPLIADSIRAGNIYDARREKSGWDTAAFDAAGWTPARTVDPPGGELSAMMMAPIRVTEAIDPIKRTEPRPGVYVFDMGQNVPGWVRLRVKGPEGTAIRLRYAEQLQPDGMLEVASIDKFVFAGPFQEDTYVLRGGGEEVWEPRFVYHGFRYVEVTGFPGVPSLDNLAAQVAHTDFAPAGQFECSDELLSTVQRLTCWSYRGNYHGYPTDCPQREKNGWTGDAHLAAEQAMFNWRNSAGYAKWVDDLRDEQKPDGNLPGIVPTGGWGYRWGNGPAWDSAYILIPWYLYLYRGDQDVLAEHYDTMKLYVDYMTSRAANGLVQHGLGDWVPARTKTPEEITSSGYYYADAVIVSKAAALLGREGDVRKYAELAKEIRAAFNSKFYKGDGRYEPATQTALSCAVYQGLADETEVPAIVKALAADAESKDGHLDTGILGAKYLFTTLSEHGYHELAYRMATRRTYPSYGLWIEQGATTLLEAWDSGGSHNHIMFGDISAWFFRYLAGIQVDPSKPGFKHIVIRPRPVGTVTWARAHHDSMYGRIESRWKLEGARFSLDVAIPPNTTATVWLPTDEVASVRKDGKTLPATGGLRAEAPEKGWARLDVPSGRYTFACDASR